MRSFKWNIFKVKLNDVCLINAIIIMNIYKIYLYMKWSTDTQAATKKWLTPTCSTSLMLLHVGHQAGAGALPGTHCLPRCSSQLLKGLADWHTKSPQNYSLAGCGKLFLEGGCHWYWDLANTNDVLWGKIENKKASHPPLCFFFFGVSSSEVLLPRPRELLFSFWLRPSERQGRLNYCHRIH